MTAFANPPDDVLYDLLAGAGTIAVVGASANPARPSYGIFAMLKAAGYRVVPVNPTETVIQGEKAYPRLRDIPFPVDIVNVFRQPAAAPAIAAEAVSIGAKALWLQLGVVSAAAAETAADGGLTVVMDNCIAVTHRLLRVPQKG